MTSAPVTTVAGAAPPIGSGDAATALRAVRLTWTAMGLFLAAVVIGFGWDRAWHGTHPFEDFWSPPHLFIYTMFTLTALTVARLALSPQLRRWFGTGFRGPVLRRELPGALVVAGAGLGMIGAAGVFDSAWHTSFGLDETGWSFPHALLSWGTFVTLLGFVSCRLALRSYRRTGRFTPMLLAILALMWATATITGPLGNNRTPELVRRIAALPVLAREESVQHTMRIYLAWTIMRTNPLFVPLAALAAGVGLALVRGLTGRLRWMIVAALLVTVLTAGKGSARYVGLADDPRTWAPLPLLPAALTLAVLLTLRVSERIAWAGAGLVLGALVVAVWGAPAPIALLAAPAMVLGAALGARVYRVVQSPVRRDVMRLVAVSCAVPAVTGIVDLWLRAHTA